MACPLINNEAGLKTFKSFNMRMMGANINRQTVENVKRAGLKTVSVENLKGELIKVIHARP